MILFPAVLVLMLKQVCQGDEVVADNSDVIPFKNEALAVSFRSVSAMGKNAKAYTQGYLKAMKKRNC